MFARSLFRKPAKQLKILQTAILAAQRRIQSHMSGGVMHLHINPRLVGLPFHPQVHFERIPGSELADQLIAVRGTVTRIGAIRMLDTSKIFICGKCGAQTEMFVDERQYGMIPKPFHCSAVIDDQRCPSTKFDLSHEQNERSTNNPVIYIGSCL